ncbi:hypothetical protein SPRG_14709 [Saprolegnia parasitica CBS 223.65]|uniref:Uncharacterized protein n=1 Tax=Saprolegnia parasitica (strain CBS 223.65) TaxID=695850 RepID=A0A067BXM5_SAPPC|nr:hypothetical protein SPRG_14709 [Saprolegnia parasitica CBS 223.65]KDO19317.1 hypothetical protein SPRG_14709 [Saprolegnia parasitica CBS 223.65]|eukprot:XP_012209991.1 hypothetical protein SPRG_14709 [Saprolegnia parasitica CBS 223.65]
MAVGLACQRYRRQLGHVSHKAHPEVTHLMSTPARFHGFVLCKLIQDRDVPTALALLATFPDAATLQLPRGKQTYTYTMDYAARARSLPLLKALHARRLGSCSNAAMDTAAANGDVAILDFLQAYTHQRCTHKGIAAARRNKHVDVLALLEEGRERCREHNDMSGAQFGFAASCAVQ